MRTTWDGLPMADDPPSGAAIIVFRRIGDDVEWLVLHRKHYGQDYDGDWAWGAPSGRRLPGEAVDACARRELMEEAGLDLELAPLLDDEKWPLFLAEVPPGAEICLSAEHDAYRWVDLATAISLIKPEWVAEQLRQAAALLGSSAG